MKSTVLLLLTSLLLVAISNRPVEGRRIGTDLLLAAVGLAGGPWRGPMRCIARDNTPSRLTWESAHMHLWDCNPNNEDQRTRWDYAPEYGYHIALGDRPDLANLCFDIPEGDIQRGRHVRLYKCNGTPAQSFQPSIVYEHLNGYPYFVLMVNSNHNLCLTVGPLFNHQNGRTLYLESCDRWHVTQFWLFMGRDGSYYRPSFPRTALPPPRTPESDKPDGNGPASPEIGMGPMRLVPVPRRQVPRVAPLVANATVARKEAE